jgi:hypothetical protein
MFTPKHKVKKKLKPIVKTDVYMLKILWSHFVLFNFSLISDISAPFAALHEPEVYYNCCFLAPQVVTTENPWFY